MEGKQGKVEAEGGGPSPTGHMDWLLGQPTGWWTEVVDARDIKVRARGHPSAGLQRESCICALDVSEDCPSPLALGQIAATQAW